MRDSIKSLSGIQKLCMFLMVSFVFASSFSCSDSKNDEGGAGVPYDPNQPVKLETFYPDSGGMATKVIIKGSNFGTDPSAIKVYYNEKRAAVVKANGTRLYVITPRTPGEICTVSVVVGKDSLTFDQTFEYTITTNVSTITGRPGTTEMTDGTLAEGTFDNPRYLCVDAEKNIYVSDWNKAGIRQINEEKNLVQTLAKENGVSLPNGPTVDLEGAVVYVPNDGGRLVFEFDPKTQWTPRRLNLNPNEGDPAFDINWKYSMVTNPKDGFIYTVAYNGNLIRFDGKSKKSWLVDTDLWPGAGDRFLAFNPLDPNLLYVSHEKLHCITIYNLETGEKTDYAGTSGQAGHQDGEVGDALFKIPRQMLFDRDGNLYIADSNNHCIRKITPEGIVTTVVGIPGSSGYLDGNPEDAQFNNPEGVAIDDDGIIYVADAGNKCIRKLSIE